MKTNKIEDSIKEENKIIIDAFEAKINNELTYTYSNGDFYRGEIVEDGIKNGLGSLTYANK